MPHRVDSKHSEADVGRVLRDAPGQKIGGGEKHPRALKMKLGCVHAFCVAVAGHDHPVRVFGVDPTAQTKALHECCPAFFASRVGFFHPHNRVNTRDRASKPPVASAELDRVWQL